VWTSNSEYIISSTFAAKTESKMTCPMKVVVVVVVISNSSTP